MAQDPLKFNLLFREGEEDLFQYDQQDPEKILNAYTRKAFLCYQWGVWVTAHARAALQAGLDLAGHRAVYCDTDSVKYIGETDFSEFNAQCVHDSLESGAHAVDPKGQEHYMGVYEQEETYRRFVTLGSKKYAYEYQDGHLGITVAGVGKTSGAEELANHGGLEAFKNGFTFSEAGGLESVYNDTPGSRWIEIDGHSWEIGPNIYLRPSTYTLGQTEDYLRLLRDPAIIEAIRRRMR